jgi:transposase
MRSEDFASHDWREWRRMRGWELEQRGWRQRDIAGALGVSESAVSQWMATARRDGPAALLAHPAPGRVPRLTFDQQCLIPEFLWHGAEAYGFPGEVWTCARVAGVIQEEFAVTYSRSQVSRLLHRLHWTPQIPITRAIQRDEQAITRWRRVSWPELMKRAKREHRVLVFEDESGFYLLPGVVKTYAPKGQTPVIRQMQTRDHLSVIGGMTPKGKVYTLARQESLNGLHTIEFLIHLLHVVSKKLLVIWDGSPDPSSKGSPGVCGQYTR